jgi:hypothetical protein
MSLIITEDYITNSETKEITAKVSATIIVRGVTASGHAGTIKTLYPPIPSKQP